MSVILAKPADIKTAIERYQSGLTLRKAMTADVNQVSYYRRENRPMAVALVAMLLTEANSTMNVNRSANSEQMASIAESVIEVWWMLRIDEVAYALRRGALGVYGTAYGKFDAQTVHEWLQKYDTSERMAQIEWANDQIKRQLQEDAKTKDEEIQDVLKGYERYKTTQLETGKNPLALQSQERLREKQRREWREADYVKFQTEYYASKNKSTNE